MQARMLVVFWQETEVNRLLENYLKKRTATKNKLHGEETLGVPSKYVYRSLKRDLKHLNKRS